jgi:glyoxylase-like metal-dependent hydrolase (beta-lactamase superfamily II)
VFIIDPGSTTQPALIPFLLSRNLKPHSVFLSHKHFDHCLGVNPLDKHFGFTLIATKSCVENIAIPDRNHSMYFEGCEAFSIIRSDTQLILEEI